MGVISQLEDGHFYLEDLTAAVEIDLSNAISFHKIICYQFISEEKTESSGALTLYVIRFLRGAFLFLIMCWISYPCIKDICLYSVVIFLNAND